MTLSALSWDAGHSFRNALGPGTARAVSRATATLEHGAVWQRLDSAPPSMPCKHCASPVAVAGLKEITRAARQATRPGFACHARLVLLQQDGAIDLVCADCSLLRYVRCYCVGLSVDCSGCDACAVWFDATDPTERFCCACQACKCTACTRYGYGSRWTTPACCDYAEAAVAHSDTEDSASSNESCCLYDWREFLVGYAGNA